MCNNSVAGIPPSSNPPSHRLKPSSESFNCIVCVIIHYSPLGYIIRFFKKLNCFLSQFNQKVGFVLKLLCRTAPCQSLCSSVINSKLRLRVDVHKLKSLKFLVQFNLHFVHQDFSCQNIKHHHIRPLLAQLIWPCAVLFH